MKAGDLVHIKPNVYRANDTVGVIIETSTQVGVGVGVGGRVALVMWTCPHELVQERVDWLEVLNESR